MTRRKPSKSTGKKQRAAGRSGSGKPPRRGDTRGAMGEKDMLFLYGLHTVRAALDNRERKAAALHVTQNARERLGPLPAWRDGLEVHETDTAALDKLAGKGAVHQGAVLHCAPLEQLDSSELFHLADADLLLVLDQITDPHNAGAIMRSAVAMSARAVLITSRHSALETPVLAKTASGALDMVPVIAIRNLSKALEELNEMRFATIGLDSEGDADLGELLDGVSQPKIALVLGAEGRGLREQTRSACTQIARLDMPGAIKSLNVSNAAAISLYLARRKIDQSGERR